MIAYTLAVLMVGIALGSSGTIGLLRLARYISEIDRLQNEDHDQ
jgi:hypothetical protein